jgi:hypothetical protein
MNDDGLGLDFMLPVALMLAACVPGRCLRAPCVCRTAASLCPSTSLWIAHNCPPARQTQVGGRGRACCCVSQLYTQAAPNHKLWCNLTSLHLSPLPLLQRASLRLRTMWSWAACASASHSWRSRPQVVGASGHPAGGVAAAAVAVAACSHHPCWPLACPALSPSQPCLLLHRAACCGVQARTTMCTSTTLTAWVAA